MAYKRVAQKVTERITYVPIDLDDLDRVVVDESINRWDYNTILSNSKNSNLREQLQNNQEVFQECSWGDRIAKDVKKQLGDKYKDLEIVVVGYWGCILAVKVPGLTIDSMISKKKQAKRILKTKRKQLVNIQKDIDSIVELFGDLENEEE